MLDLLLETHMTEEQREYAESTRLCACKLLEIMNATLEFSALAARQIALEESEFRFTELLSSIVDEFAFKAKQKGLTLIRRFDRTLPESVVGDGLRVKQLLSKIIENALKFTSEGQIEIVTLPPTPTSGGVILTVQVVDTGAGIAKNTMTCIFDSFHQADRGIARRHTGLGLGLSVAHELGKLMKAEFSVDSELGKGSTFSISIPLALPGSLRHQPPTL